MKELNKNNFRDEIKQGLVAVDFWAPWCGSCMQLLPILEEIDKERNDVNIVKFNSDEDMGLAREFGVMSLPTIVVFKDGQEIGRINGFKPKDSLNSELNEIVK